MNSYGCNLKEVISLFSWIYTNALPKTEFLSQKSAECINAKQLKFCPIKAERQQAADAFRADGFPAGRRKNQGNRFLLLHFIFQ